MTVLSFKVTGSSLVRTDMNRLVTFTRNNAAARFDFDKEWAGVSPVVAQFRKSDECCYDVFVENCMCVIPWEVLEEKGTLYVSVMGGDLITTNCVNVSVIDTGIVGGLVPTAASPSVYSAMMEALEKIEAYYGEINDFIENIDTYTKEYAEKAASEAAETATDEVIKKIEEKAEELIDFTPITDEEINELFL